MNPPRWFPASEADATTNLAYLVEWLRATRGWENASPDLVRTWQQTDPSTFRAAVGAFAGLRPELGWQGNLLHGDGQEALVLWRNGQRTAWSRAALRATSAHCLPPALAARLAAATWPELLALAAATLIDADTRPADRLLWQGDPADPWSLGGLLAGATVILPLDAAPDYAGLAIAERAGLVRRPV
jgi:hypothetical protein